jgi:YVTN family beta-propeller protein
VQARKVRAWWDLVFVGVLALGFFLAGCDGCIMDELLPDSRLKYLPAGFEWREVKPNVYIGYYAANPAQSKVLYWELYDRIGDDRTKSIQDLPPGIKFNSEGQVINPQDLGPVGTGSLPGASPKALGLDLLPRAAASRIIRLFKTNSSSNTVVVFDTVSSTVLATTPVGNHPRGIDVTPDGSLALVANRDSSSVSVIDIATYRVVSTIALPASQPYGVAITPDGSTAYVANGIDPGGAVYVIDIAKRAVTGTIAVGGRPFKVAVSPDGTQALVTNNAPGTVSAIDTTTNTVVKTISVGAAAFGVAFHPNGTRGYVTANGNLVVIDMSTYAILAQVKVGTYPVSVRVTPDGLRALVANRLSDFISYFDTSTSTVVENITVGQAPEEISFVPAQ